MGQMLANGNREESTVTITARYEATPSLKLHCPLAMDYSLITQRAVKSQPFCFGSGVKCRPDQDGGPQQGPLKWGHLTVSPKLVPPAGIYGNGTPNIGILRPAVNIRPLSGMFDDGNYMYIIEPLTQTHTE
eukprot:g31356.t1